MELASCATDYSRQVSETARRNRDEQASSSAGVQALLDALLAERRPTGAVTPAEVKRDVLPMGQRFEARRIEELILEMAAIRCLGLQGY
jgi:hypothetical protein